MHMFKKTLNLLLDLCNSCRVSQDLSQNISPIKYKNFSYIKAFQSLGKMRAYPRKQKDRKGSLRFHEYPQWVQLWESLLKYTWMTFAGDHTPNSRGRQNLTADVPSLPCPQFHTAWSKGSARNPEVTLSGMPEHMFTGMWVASTSESNWLHHLWRSQVKL